MDHQLIAECVAQTALHHYAKDLPSKGKPKENEWTVYAAIVAHSPRADGSSSPFWVVSSATGTKCTATRCQGHVLHDSHAEVLARRGLVRTLWTEIAAATSQTDQTALPRTYRRLLELDDKKVATATQVKRCFRLRRDLQLHMYVSDSPCGDASIYEVTGDDTSPSLQFTGAKVIVSPDTNVSVEACGGSQRMIKDERYRLAREDMQLLSKLRSKSGRSNLDSCRRSSSMSCSDKLVRWGVLGMQGRLLMQFIAEPLRLASLVVSRDPRVESSLVQELALRRAVPERIFAAETHARNERVDSSALCSIPLPHVSICDKIFDRGKSVVEALQAKGPRETTTPTELFLPRKRKRDSHQRPTTSVFSPTGLSIHWQQSDPTVELVVGARGIRQGKKPKTTGAYANLQSRLSRAALISLAQESALIETRQETSASTESYQTWKREHSCEEAETARRYVMKNGPLAGWMIGGNESDFEVRNSSQAQY